MRNAVRRVEPARYYKQKSVLPLCPLPETMTFEVRRIIRADHPSLPGHFPGAPLVPGVVILDEVLEALIEWRRNSKLTGIRTVKFLAPLKPEHPFTICLSADDPRPGEVNFCCRAEDRVIVEGRLEVVWEAT